MANPEHLRRFKEGSRRWNPWHADQRTADPQFQADLSGAELFDTNPAEVHEMDLRNANLQDANLSARDVTGADFRGAELDRAVAQRAILVGARFQNARLKDSNFVQADLTDATFADANCDGANLRGAQLLRAIFNRTVLAEADFSGAKLGGTTLTDLDLSTTKGLGYVFHIGPSSIGIDTWQRSRGEHMAEFLRNAGVPRECVFRESDGEDFDSCFISYAMEDEEFVDRLYADLKAHRVDCWYAPQEMKGGRKLRAQIDRAIRLHDRLLLILSPHSMDSEWVRTEISLAREREHKEGKQILFPISLVPFESIREWRCFDADRGKDSACEVREYFIPDFSDWKNTCAYRISLARLIPALRKSRP